MRHGGSSEGPRSTRVTTKGNTEGLPTFQVPFPEIWDLGYEGALNSSEPEAGCGPLGV